MIEYFKNEGIKTKSITKCKDDDKKIYVTFENESDCLKINEKQKIV